MTPTEIRLDTKLPPHIAQLMSSVKEKRIANNCIALDGSAQRSPEKAIWWNDLAEWKINGKPKNELRKLKLREIALRNAGKF